jgi:hypothetical protein
MVEDGRRAAKDESGENSWLSGKKSERYRIAGAHCVGNRRVLRVKGEAGLIPNRAVVPKWMGGGA